MTFILGWKYNNEVQIISDSLVTMRNDGFIPNSKLTTFKENVLVDRNLIVAEGLLKIFTISDKVVFAFAGINDFAFDLSQDLQRRVEHFGFRFLTDFIKILDDSIANCLKNGDEIQLILGVLDENGVSHLVTYNYQGTKHIEEQNQLVMMGSLSDYHPSYFSELISLLASIHLPADVMLHLSLSAIQQRTVGFYLVDQGVGGVIAGIRMTYLGYKWFDDLTYFICDRNITNPLLISIGVRNNTVISLVHDIGERNVFSNPTNFIYELESFKVNVLEPTIETFKNGLTNYFTVLRIDEIRIGVVLMDANFRSPELSFERQSENQARIGLSPKLRDFITSQIDKNTAPIIGSEPFTLTIFTGR